jgi:hypothetical protein
MESTVLVTEENRLPPNQREDGLVLILGGEKNHEK